MNTREIVIRLVQEGFKVQKEGSRHILYAKNGVVVPVVRGSKTNPRAVSSLNAAIRRAERGVLPSARSRFI